jgi:hypothetical protein
MAIWIDKIGSDDQKLPVVSWIEDRIGFPSIFGSRLGSPPLLAL